MVVVPGRHLITNSKNKEGKKITRRKEIVKMATNFYKKLYERKEIRKMED